MGPIFCWMGLVCREVQRDREKAKERLGKKNEREAYEKERARDARERSSEKESGFTSNNFERAF